MGVLVARTLEVKSLVFLFFASSAPVLSECAERLPPAWVDAAWLKQHGPPDLCPPGFDRSSSDELVANYLHKAP